MILQAVLGLDAARIASAFLTSPAAMGKRLVRAKVKIRQTGIPFRVPGRDELPGRLDVVLQAIYAAFSEGWTDPGGADAVRRDLAEEAIYLARLVAELLPNEPEALGLLALLLHAESRRKARRSLAGEFIPLARQDPALWNTDQIDEAESLLHRASKLGSIGRFQLEAALQSAHADRCRTGRPNWAFIIQLYDALFALAESPVVAINRAVAIAELQGASAGLDACPASKRTAASPSTSPIGPRAQSYSHAPAHSPRLATRTKSPSASNATKPSAASSTPAVPRFPPDFRRDTIPSMPPHGRGTPNNSKVYAKGKRMSLPSDLQILHDQLDDAERDARQIPRPRV
jgi:hypothetical protein